MEKIWLVTQESNCDGEILFNVTPCICKETAKEVFKRAINYVFTECHNYKDYNEWPNDFTIEQTDTHFFIKDNVDDYYEEINIEEKDIQY